MTLTGATSVANNCGKSSRIYGIVEGYTQFFPQFCRRSIFYRSNCFDNRKGDVAFLVKLSFERKNIVWI
ncbi:hypothetical protein C492_07350 [Natronococcus jeotgali DSM 18795]|uniref:Uncharacterized protein n=1 Tax=Natronococcus jeotgali DSM 18795 TaxID=1227498 RepID=L9XN89_9EURY|nr:hypothetical protein C492_07350 [Natronococcus jeotgali DSM 18795]